jgi:hypothetical protein
MCNDIDGSPSAGYLFEMDHKDAQGKDTCDVVRKRWEAIQDAKKATLKREKRNAAITGVLFAFLVFVLLAARIYEEYRR